MNIPASLTLKSFGESSDDESHGINISAAIQFGIMLH
jgi:hypothetical protein